LWGWNTWVSMKVTEAGIHDPNGQNWDRGYRYVEFGRTVANETAGQVDSVCFYGLPDVEDGYSINETQANQVGTHP